MTEMNATIDIERPLDEVYAFVSDPANDGRWRAGLLSSGMVDDAPREPGEVGFSRVEGRNEPSEIHWRILEMHAPEHISWELLDGPFRGSGGYQLEPTGTGTRFTLLADLEPQGAMRLLGPVFGWFGRRRNQADVRALKRLLEGAG